MSKKILVTGATGFIGRHLIDKLIKNDKYDVYALVRKEDFEFIKLKEKFLNFHLVKIDEIEKKTVVGDLDVIYHLAATRHFYGTTEEDYIKGNIELTKKILNFALDFKAKHFIMFGSTSVYGSHAELPISESTVKKPETFYAKLYAETKLKSENLVIEFCKNKKINYTILRPSIVYGIGDDKGLIYKLFGGLINNKFRIIGNGENKLHFVHVYDVANAAISCIDNKNAYNNDFIIAGNRDISINELVNSISKIAQVDPPSFKVPYLAAYLAASVFELFYKMGFKITGQEPLVSFEKLGIITANLYYSYNKASKLIDYQPSITLEDGLNEFYSYYFKSNVVKNKSYRTNKQNFIVGFFLKFASTVLWILLWIPTSLFVSYVFIKNWITKPHKNEKNVQIDIEDVEEYDGKIPKEEKIILIKFIERNVKAIEGSLDEGIGTVYERLVIDDYFKYIQEKYNIKTVLESPADGVTGVPGLNSLEFSRNGGFVTLANPSQIMLDNAKKIWVEKGLMDEVEFVKCDIDNLLFENNSFDLSWNYCMFERFSKPEIIVNELKRTSKKYVLVMTQNMWNLGTVVHFLYHAIHKLSWDHGNVSLMRMKNIRKTLIDCELNILEEGTIDTPPWLDTWDMPLRGEIKTFLKPLGIKWEWKIGENSSEIVNSNQQKNERSGIMKFLIKIERNLPKYFSMLNTHHYYVLAEKK